MKKDWNAVYAGFKASNIEETVRKDGIAEIRRFETDGYKYDFIFVKNELCKIEAFDGKNLIEIHTK